MKETLVRAIMGEWSVFHQPFEINAGLRRLGSLAIGLDSYRFTADADSIIPAQMAKRVVFFVQPSGRLAYSYPDDVNPHPCLLAYLTFGDNGGENMYAVVASGKELCLAPMFHAAVGINVPPIVSKYISTDIES